MSFLDGGLTGLLGGGSGMIGSAIQGRRAEREARRNREFQERMANTVWQRGVRDMRKAGINPMLAFMKGGAPAPGGSMASFVHGGDPVASGLAAKRQREETKFKKQEREQHLLDRQTQRALWWNSALTQAQLGSVYTAQARKTDIEARLAEHLLPGAKLESKYDTSQEGYLTRRLGRWMGAFWGADNSAKRVMGK